MKDDEIKPFCPGCKKKPTIHVTSIVNGELTEMHLCADCPLLKELHIQKQVGLADLLSGLLGLQPKVETSKTIDLRCPNCGMTWEEFSKTGRLGCSECYTAFKNQMNILLKNIHGTNQHVGKGPLKAGKPQIKEQSQVNRIEYLLNLKDQMNEAVEIEDYERAAKIRDMIRDLEKQENKNNKNNGHNIHHS